MAKRIEFIALYLLTQFFRYMPFFIVYTVSWCAYILVFYFIGYRKKVVYENLRNAFPEMSKPGLKKIAKRFYHNFCDVLAETLKGVFMSERSLKKRFLVLNPELVDNFYYQNKSVIAMGAHYGNSEWGKILGMQLKHPLIVIYSPFSNKYINQYYNRCRTKFGMQLVNVSKTFRVFTELRNKPHGYIMGVDQRPFDQKSAYWLSFLNQDTPCHKGYEQLARKFNIPVVYSDIQRVKKGYYTVNYILLCKDPSGTEEGEIVRRFMQTLEKIIYRKPEDWLWSHKRWKYQRPNACPSGVIDAG